MVLLELLCDILDILEHGQRSIIVMTSPSSHIVETLSGLIDVMVIIFFIKIVIWCFERTHRQIVSDSYSTTISQLQNINPPKHSQEDVGTITE
jgi:hypothetical protein